LQIGGHQLAIVLRGDAGVGFGEDHFHQVERRSEERPIAIHRPQLLRLAALQRLAQGFFDA
jgi:hypothetical protein